MSINFLESRRGSVKANDSTTTTIAVRVRSKGIYAEIRLCAEAVNLMGWKPGNFCRIGWGEEEDVGKIWLLAEKEPGSRRYLLFSRKGASLWLRPVAPRWVSKALGSTACLDWGRTSRFEKEGIDALQITLPPCFAELYRESVGTVADAIKDFTDASAKLGLPTRAMAPGEPVRLAENFIENLARQAAPPKETEPPTTTAAPAATGHPDTEAPTTAPSATQRPRLAGLNSVDSAVSLLRAIGRSVVANKDGALLLDGFPVPNERLCRSAMVDYVEGDEYMNGAPLVVDPISVKSVMARAKIPARQISATTWEIDGQTTPWWRVIEIATATQAQPSVVPIEDELTMPLDEALNICRGRGDKVAKSKHGWMINGRVMQSRQIVARASAGP